MYRRLSVMTSALIWILLPKCSACLMAYMGLFSALGLGRLVHHAYMLPVIWLVLACNLAVSLYLSLKEKQYGYAIISFGCALLFVLNKLFLDSVVLNIATAVVLIIAGLRIRLMRAGDRKCLFSEGKESGCRQLSAK